MISTCVDTMGSFTCSCANGFFWDGSSCLKKGPRPVSALMESSLGAVRIVFDIPTNMAGQFAQVSFSCSNLFPPLTIQRFGTYPERSLCTFLDTQTLVVQLGPGTSVQPGVSIDFAPTTQPLKILLAETTLSGATDSSISVTASTSGLPSPVIVLNAPSRQVICQNSRLVLDASASSGGGSNPLSFQWSSGNAAVNAFLSGSSSARVEIPGDLISSSVVQLSVSLTATSFVGRSTTESRTIQIISGIVPAVTILGASQRSVTRGGMLKLEATVSSECISNPESLQLTWSSGASTGVKLEASGTSVEISTDSLVIGREYRIRLTAASRNRGNDASGWAEVVVVATSRAVRARISGGTEKRIGVSEALVLENASIDPDESDSPWACEWKCEAAWNGGSCPSPYSTGVRATEKITVLANTLSTGEYRWSLSVKKDPGARSDKSEVHLIVSSVAPSFRGEIKGPTSPVPASNPVRFHFIPSGNPVPAVEWKVVSGSPGIKSLTSNLGLEWSITNLLPGRKYRVGLTTLTSSPTEFVFDFSTVSAPFGGICRVTPSQGFVAVSLFTLGCTGWTADSEQLPLVYRWSIAISPSSSATSTESFTLSSLSTAGYSIRTVLDSSMQPSRPAPMSMFAENWDLVACVGSSSTFSESCNFIRGFEVMSPGIIPNTTKDVISRLSLSGDISGSLNFINSIARSTEVDSDILVPSWLVSTVDDMSRREVGIQSLALILEAKTQLVGFSICMEKLF